MNDEAAESPGRPGPAPDGPELNGPGPANPATPDTDAPAETAAPDPGEAPTAGLPSEPPTAEAAGLPSEPPTAEMPTAHTPPAWAPPAGGFPEADEPPPAAPPPGDVPPPPGANNPPGANMPPWTTTYGGPAFSRDQLVRPRQGRYVAGVCAALARATNTDPVLWRVLIAVLGVLSGVGVLFYLIGWLIIPAEGDTASPIESLLGKGRSGMAPLSVVVLGAGAVFTFAFIVHSGMRSAVLVAAVVLGAVLLIRRNGTGQAATFPAPAAAPGAGPGGAGGGFGGGADSGPGPVPATAGAAAPTAQFTAPSFGAPPTGAPATGTPAEEPVTASIPPLAPEPPDYTSPGYTPPRYTPGYATPATSTAGGYRPPFAPHGPWGSTPQQTEAPPQPQRPPRRPRERSKLGRLTFFAVIVVIGLMVVLSMAGAHIAVSAYFAAALVTIALGLILGAWVGRARGLIALALLCSFGLAVSSGAEHFGSHIGNSVYRPATLAAVADRYDFTAGNATLDLRDITFTGPPQTVTATMKVGQLKILLPPTVDTTATVQLKNGRAVILGKELNDHDVDGTTVTDQGTDGAGGGTLKLDLQMDTGNLEVSR